MNTVGVGLDGDEQGGGVSRGEVEDFKESRAATSTTRGVVEVGLEVDLLAQLDTLAALTYPNSSIRCVFVETCMRPSVFYVVRADYCQRALSWLLAEIQ